MSVKIYVEGGGNHQKTVSQCRKAFSEYFGKFLPGRKPRVIPSGDRQSAYDDFCTAIMNERDKYDLILLLVDSEEQILSGRTAWQHLKARDNWDRPNECTDRHAHLMVQCMESWFLADRDALVTYYGQGFLDNALPNNRANIEMISKADVFRSLENATKNTTKGVYHKTKHGFDLLGRIDPARVAAASDQARRLRETLGA